jgi:superfamily II DNA/RNA helicase
MNSKIENFENTGLSAPTLDAVTKTGYLIPTPIQVQVIPAILNGRDVFGIAQTGTGKTASFTLPMVDLLSAGKARARMPRSIVLTPTRELAQQVAENFDTYSTNSKLKKALLIGGESMVEQERTLAKGVDVLIATPGRLLDMFGRGKILLSDIKILVLDEADRMLDMGFMPDIEKLMTLIPKKRQTLLFSATLPDEIKKLGNKLLNDPLEVMVSKPSTTNVNVRQNSIHVAAKNKREALRAFIEKEKPNNAIIFCNRKRDASVLSKSLLRHKYNAAELHGDLTQAVRTKTLEQFRRGEISILVASDVAARGLDVAGLSLVVNFEVPHNYEDYVHRIGRTGRAGEKGHAVTFVEPETEGAWKKLCKEASKEIEVYEVEFHPAKKEKDVSSPKEKETRSPQKKKSAPHQQEPSPQSEQRQQHRPSYSHEDILLPPMSAEPVKGFGEHTPPFMNVKKKRGFFL